MNKKARYSILVFFTIVLGVFYFWNETAEAGRMGRSRSFGSRPSYQRSAPAPAPSRSPASSQTKPGQTAQQPSSGAPSSPMGRFGGMVGGMLMGGLIGSMLFGGGHGIGGGPGLLDFLLIGGGLFLLFRFFKNRRMAGVESGMGVAMPFQNSPGPSWGSVGYTPREEASVSGLNQPFLPPGFDGDEFLKGANAIYVRLQNSWDKRDLGDIRQFTSDEVFREIQQQALEDSVPGKTELLQINPRIIEAREMDDQSVVTVLFDVILRENEDPVSKQVRELWHFSRDRNQPESFWILEGIQQVE